MSDTDRDRIREYCKQNPDVLDGEEPTYALAEGQLFHVTYHPTHGVDLDHAHGYDLVICPRCGDAAEHVDSLTVCCREPIPGGNL